MITEFDIQTHHPYNKGMDSFIEAVIQQNKSTFAHAKIGQQIIIQENKEGGIPLKLITLGDVIMPAYVRDLIFINQEHGFFYNTLDATYYNSGLYKSNYGDQVFVFTKRKARQCDNHYQNIGVFATFENDFS